MSLFSSKFSTLSLNPLTLYMHLQPQRMLAPVLSTTLMATLSMSVQALTQTPDQAFEKSSEKISEKILAQAQTQPKSLDTIVVNASQQSDFNRPINLSAYATKQWVKVPASINVLGEDWIATHRAQNLSDIIQHDAAMGENYAPIGYYANVVSRGVALDYASSFLINGQLVRGEQNIALENKQQVEILKGISALHSGMASAGGVVNYVTKRAADVRRLSLDVDEYGDQRAAMDLGGFVGAQQQFGYRVNVAQQNIRPYVEYANGERQFGSLALDWEINDRAKVLFDIEGLRQQQRSVPGYQLLDGKIPTSVKWDRLLGNIGAFPAVTMRSLNSQLQLQYQFNPDWSGALIASTSRVKNNDNSAFAFGCFSDICQATTGILGFDAQGNYDIYNFQIPKDQYATDQFKASLNGSFATGDIQHHLIMDVAHSQKQRQRYEGINELIGTGNIYSNEVNITLPLNMNAKVNEYKALESAMTSFNLLDRIEWNSQWSSIFGGKWISLNEKAYTATHQLSRKTNMDSFLAQVALMYAPHENVQFYTSYSEGLSDGAMAPWYSANNFEILAPIQSHQYELGLKYQIQNYLLSAAIFHLEKDHQGPRPISPTQDNPESYFEFVHHGQQVNQGVELGVDGQITEALRLKNSFAYTHARLKNTGVASMQSHQVQNVPRLRLSTFADYDVAAINGLSVLGGLRYSSSKYAHRDGIAKVSGFSVVDVGAAYQFNLAGYDSTIRFNVDNVFNKKYWRDAGGYLGDDYLFLGDPRTAKLGVEINF